MTSEATTVTTDERPETGVAPSPVSNTGSPSSQPLGGPPESPHILGALEQLRGVLVPGETLEAYAVQRRIFALTKRRALVAATSGRFIALLRGFFGGFTPIDMRWQDIEEAHLKVGIVGADITVRAMRREDLASANLAGGVFFAGGLRKEQAQGVYRVCQAQSQSWREKRRIRDLDELRAKSGGIQLGSGTSVPGGPGRDDGDPVARLQRAKEMLTAGLITDAEYESIKAKIVDRL
jgi:Bacterial PH domain